MTELKYGCNHETGADWCPNLWLVELSPHLLEQDKKRRHSCDEGKVSLVNAVQVQVTTTFFSLTFWSALTSTTIVPGHHGNGLDNVNGQ